jgi:hypothetical protein
VTDVLGVLAARSLGVPAAVRPAIRPLYDGGLLGATADEEDIEREVAAPRVARAVAETDEREVEAGDRVAPAEARDVPRGQPRDHRSAERPVGRSAARAAAPVAVPDGARVAAPERSRQSAAAPAAPAEPAGTERVLTAPESVPPAAPAAAPTAPPPFAPAVGPAPRAAALARESRPEPRAAERVVHVTIGRIDVRAVPAPTPERPARAPAKPSVGLDEYLRAGR